MSRGEASGLRCAPESILCVERGWGALAIRGCEVQGLKVKVPNQHMKGGVVLSGTKLLTYGIVTDKSVLEKRLV